ncbi:MAG: type 4a pilus biogenesis protein PilO [Candidatus Aminicenantes bacterium]|nr:type 4a pilus biogenesis protein PilO [Candidatus Aminicenantes bacterium]
MKNFHVGILFLGFSIWIFSVKMVDLKERQAELMKSRERLASLKTSAARLKLLEEEIKTLEATLPDLEKALPSEADLQKIVKDFSGFSRDTRVYLTNISSSRTRRLSKEDPYLLWEISLQGGTMTYENVISFLSKIESMKRAISPLLLEVKYNRNWKKEKRHRLVISGRFKTYIRRRKP